MRPTSPQILYSWYETALRGDVMPPTKPPTPRCGYYRVALRDAAQSSLPARIWARQVTDADTGRLVEPESLQADLGVWPTSAEAIWPGCTPISRAEFAALMADLGVATPED